jgi:hypothetical protein
MQARYCIGVDELNFPIYVIHYIPETPVCNEYANSKLKQSKVDLRVKHYHMQHK